MSLSPIKGSSVSLIKKLYPRCLVLVDSRNGFESNLHLQQIVSSHFYCNIIRDISSFKMEANLTHKMWRIFWLTNDYLYVEDSKCHGKEMELI